MLITFYCHFVICYKNIIIFGTWKHTKRNGGQILMKTFTNKLKTMQAENTHMIIAIRGNLVKEVSSPASRASTMASLEKATTSGEWRGWNLKWIYSFNLKKYKQ